MARPKKVISIEDREKICYLYQVKRKTMGEITELFPFSIAIVVRVLDEAGIKRKHIRPRKHPAWQHVDEIVSLYVNDEWAPRPLEEKYDCSRTVIEDILKSKNVPLRTRKKAQQIRQEKEQSPRERKAKIKEQIERLPEPLGRWLFRIHSDGCLPDTRRFARRFNLPHDLVWDVSCKLQKLK